MDLWTPKKDQNTYGARDKKGIKTGSIGAKSYVPAGLSGKYHYLSLSLTHFLYLYLTLGTLTLAAQYAKIRAEDEKKKAVNYQKNVQKAFKYEDFTAFYLKRGTSEGGSWLNAPAKGHRMAKTKYDYSGAKVEDNKLPEAFSFGKKK